MDMTDLFWLTDTQMARLAPFLPKSHSKPCVDDRHVLSGIIFINSNGLRWHDAPAGYGPHKALYNRWKRWSDKGIFARMMTGLAAEDGEKATVMIDATYLKAQRTATCMGVKKGAWAPNRANQRRVNTKLYAIRDNQGRPVDLFMTAGQVRGYIGARALLEGLPKVG